MALFDPETQALRSGTGSEALRAELALLQQGDFGDLINIDTPYFKQHGDVTKERAFMGRVDRVFDVTNAQDPVVDIAHATDLGPDMRMADHPKRTEIPWTLGPNEGPPARASLIEATTERGNAQHSWPVRSADGFRDKIGSRIEATEQREAVASR